MQTETIETYQIKPGDRVEFRQYGYKQEYAYGKILKVDAKSVTVVVDRSQRRAKYITAILLKYSQKRKFILYS